MPFGVTLLPVNDDDVTNRLTIVYGAADPPVRFTHCISPLHDYENRNQLIETLEANMLLGVNRFVIYNHSIRADVMDATLASYVRDGIVRVIPWHIPAVFSRNNLHYFGQRAALNDCLYRYMYATQLMLSSDTDELIVPSHRADSDWNGLITRLDPQQKSYVYQFRNAFFYTRLADTGRYARDTLAREFNVSCLLKTQRERTTDRPPKRVKCIWRPERLKMIQVHFLFDIFFTA